MERVVLKVRCNDRPGIVAAAANFILEKGGNIVNLDQFTEREADKFFCRIEWEQEEKADEEALNAEVKQLLIDNGLCLTYELFLRRKRLRMGIFVSKYDHCLYDVLFRQRAGELNCEIPVIISNHQDLKYVADNFGVDFYHVPINDGNRGEAERQEMKLLEKYQVDFVALARYMQILSPEFIEKYPNKIINIHHSFLPAFKGAKPYRQAFERGVKMVGATAHFVTEVLDQGPIIAQDIIKISHRENIKELTLKGRDVERRVFSKAIEYYTDHRIFLCGHKTIIL